MANFLDVCRNPDFVAGKLCARPASWRLVPTYIEASRNGRLMRFPGLRGASEYHPKVSEILDDWDLLEISAVNREQAKHWEKQNG